MPLFRKDMLLHPATAIASVALFVSLGGVTYAAATIGTRQIKNDAVTRAKIADRAVGAPQMAPAAVTGSRIAKGTISGSNLAPGVAVAGEGALELLTEQIASGQSRQALLSAPDQLPGQFQAACANGVATISYVGAAGTVVVSGLNAAAGSGAATPFVQAGTPGDGGTVSAPPAGAGGVQSSTWQIAPGSGTTGITAWVSTVAAGANCIATVQLLASAP